MRDFRGLGVGAGWRGWMGGERLEGWGGKDDSSERSQRTAHQQPLRVSWQIAMVRNLGTRGSWRAAIE